MVRVRGMRTKATNVEKERGGLLPTQQRELGKGRGRDICEILSWFPAGPPPEEAEEEEDVSEEKNVFHVNGEIPETFIWRCPAGRRKSESLRTRKKKT